MLIKEMFPLLHYAWQLAFLVSVLVTTSSSASDGDCHVSSDIPDDFNYNIIETQPFLYCLKSDTPKSDTPKWIGKIFDDWVPGICTMSSASRVKLEDVWLFDAKSNPKTTETEECRPWGKLGYKTQTNAACDASLVEPFLESFSSRNPIKENVTEFVLNSNSHLGKNQIVYYNFSCVEVEDKDTIDMCRHNTSLFDNSSQRNLKLIFKPESLGDSSSCHCDITSSDPREPVKVRALDIRLSEGNRLMFDSNPVQRKYALWWKDGFLSEYFTKIRLLDLSPHKLPSRVWMAVYGFNLTVTCNNKPLDSSGGSDGHSANPASFSMTYIIGIVAGAICLLVLMFITMRCLKKRGNEREEKEEMEEYRVAQPISDRPVSVSQPDEENLLTTTQADVEYSKPRTYHDRGGSELYSKTRVSGKHESEDDECQLADNSPSSNSNENSLSQNYSHFGDKPDIVPSSSSNIYDTTGVDEYSVFDRNPASVTTDNVYDVA